MRFCAALNVQANAGSSCRDVMLTDTARLQAVITTILWALIECPGCDMWHMGTYSSNNSPGHLMQEVV